MSLAMIGVPQPRLPNGAFEPEGIVTGVYSHGALGWIVFKYRGKHDGAIQAYWGEHMCLPPEYIIEVDFRIYSTADSLTKEQWEKQKPPIEKFILDGGTKEQLHPDTYARYKHLFPEEAVAEEVTADTGLGILDQAFNATGISAYLPTNITKVHKKHKKKNLG